MRLWHYKLLPYLPDAQIKGQWRECCLIAKNIEEKGKPNHLLVNILEDYIDDEFITYCHIVRFQMRERGFNVSTKAEKQIYFRPYTFMQYLFTDWHNKEYLRVCMANLYEKHFFGVGKSRITDEEWQRLLDGYKTITGEEYVI